MTSTVFEAGGRREQIETAALCDRLDVARHRLPAPFDPARMNVIATIADAIAKRKGGVSPGIAYFGFWTRRAALRQLEQDFRARCPPATLPRPRGVVFHLPPRNVETIFLYSWILAYLMGNANIVRMPAEVGDEVAWVLDQVIAALDAAGDRCQMFVHYPADNDVSQQICAGSDARIVWGGDSKVAVFERMPLRHGGKSIWFGDRSSLCVVRGTQVATLDEVGMADLAERLANDIFLFDQMACSSPHGLYVVGTAQDHLPAIKALLVRIGHAAMRKGQSAAAGHQIAKLTAGFSAAASGEATDVSWRDGALTSAVAGGPMRIDRRVGGGFLSVVFIDSLAHLTTLFRDKDQTVTHFGFAPPDIREAAESYLGPGAARWTPVGSALEFDAIWDGYDILTETTRLVRVKT